MEPDPGEELVAVVDAANTSFAEGDYRRTCSYYTARVRRQIVRDTNARSCADAWRITAASLAGTLTRAQQDALTSYGIDPASASISGTTAEARFEPVPEALRRVLDAPPAPLRFRRVGRDWKIDSVPL